MVKKVLREIKNDKGHVIQTQEELVKEPHERDSKEPVHAPPQPQQTQKIQENVKVSDSAVSTKTAAKKSSSK